MRTLSGLAALAIVAAGPAAAATDTSATKQIYQQRLADGRTLLTDHPAAGAKTERSWQVQLDNPAAARQRALEVSAEAQAVSDRVARYMEQLRLAEMESMRYPLMPVDYDRLGGYDGDYAVGGLGWYGPQRPYWPQRHRSRFDNRFDNRFGPGTPSHGGPHMRLTGSAMPGSRSRW